MSDVLSLAGTIERAGIVFVLALYCIVVTIAYLQERKRNEKLHATMLESSKEVLAAYTGSTVAIGSLKDLIMTLRPYVTTTQYYNPVPAVEPPKPGGIK